VLAAALGGILHPAWLHRLGVDPAVASGPFVTTVTDVVGLFLVPGHRDALVRLEIALLMTGVNQSALGSVVGSG
jgi:Mg/Co/Ni transporter MgtE